MTTEEKDLLRKELCARFPYGVIVGYSTKDNPNILDKIGRVIYVDIRFGMIQMQSESGTSYGLPPSEFIKPYLRPMSSMTKEETKELFKEIGFEFTCNTCGIPAHYNYEFAKQIKGIPTITNVEFIKVIDWLNTHHFDYRGLIPKGLAIEVTEENNPYED